MMIKVPGKESNIELSSYNPISLLANYACNDDNKQTKSSGTIGHLHVNCMGIITKPHQCIQYVVEKLTFFQL